MKKSRDRGSIKITKKFAAERRDQVAAIVNRLPEAGAVAAGNHLSLEVCQ
jgi:hypothetical protein